MRQKLEEGGKVLLLNVGDSRGDSVATERIGWEGGAGALLPVIAREVYDSVGRGLTEPARMEIETMLKSGKVKIPGGGFATS